MRPANWTRARPHSLPQAFQLCVEYAREVNRKKMPELAELIGKNQASLYKWIADGNMPANLILPFENACGCDYVTRYLGSTRNRMVIDIPRGRKCDATEVAELNVLFADCVAKLAKFFKGQARIEETSDAIDASMRALAWHQQNVDLHMDPTGALFDTEVEQ